MLVKGVGRFAINHGFYISTNPCKSGLDIYCAQRKSTQANQPAENSRVIIQSGQNFLSLGCSCRTQCKYRHLENQSSNHPRRQEDQDDKKYDVTSDALFSDSNIIDHCHDMLSDATAVKLVYSAARSLDLTDHVKGDIKTFLKHSVTQLQINNILNEKGITVRPHDIYNIKQRELYPHLAGLNKNDAFNAQIKYMRENGFIVKVKENDDNVGRVVLDTHPGSVALAKQYGEALSMDCTYKTSDLELPTYIKYTVLNV